MIRPCFLVIDREFPGSISTRKLVIETAKFNVITAYSGQEALQLFQRFPAIDGVVMDGGLEDIKAEDLTRELKTVDPKIPVIVIAAPGFVGCPDADFQLESFAPAKLLEILCAMKPKESAQIEERDEELSREDLN